MYELSVELGRLGEILLGFQRYCWIKGAAVQSLT